MSNHVHLVLVPRRAESLGLALKHAHGRYASYWNATHHSSGHVWQGRYYSCPLDEPHLWEALRYTELNPVRAGLVAESESWMWSSAAVHCARVPDSGWLALELWQSRWTADSWRAFLKAKESASELAAICLSTHTGRPLGTAEFVHALERSTQRPLAPQRVRSGDRIPIPHAVVDLPAEFVTGPGACAVGARRFTAEARSERRSRAAELLE
jgi:putative transposase